MKQNKIAMIYDFDGTLTPKTMQEYTLLPKLGLNPKSFWDSINEESKRTGGETMMVFMRHLLEQSKEKNIKISKNEFFKMEITPSVFNIFARTFWNQLRIAFQAYCQQKCLM